MFNSPQTLQRVIDFLNDHHIPYMLIGGLVVSVWGETRVTQDADFKVNIDMPLDEFRNLVLKHFPERPMNIPAHRKSPHIVHIWASPEVVEHIILRQRGKLDVKYIRTWLTQFAEALESPEMLDKFNEFYESINS